MCNNGDYSWEAAQTHKGKSEQGKWTLNLPSRAHDKVEEVPLLAQSPELKTKELRLYTRPYYLAEYSISFLSLYNVVWCHLNKQEKALFYNRHSGF